MAQPLFHSPDHDHARCEAEAIAEAEAVCAARGTRLTPLRRRVLGVLASGHRPLGAYEIMDRLAQKGPRPAPITVYRALDFLMENGLAHRLASRNAFLACLHAHGASESVIFLICERCGAVGEASSSAVRDMLARAAEAAGFSPKAPLIEVSGLCAHCRAAQDAPQ
ncbi:MAG TPA: Fur family transcriptional regulator [Xanthobacteraceae bacterium]|nr:Fur family transcriptional regulator [Xanthobacteraceae bacterium]